MPAEGSSLPKGQVKRSLKKKRAAYVTASVSEPFAPNERKTKAPYSGITGSFISPVKRQNEGHLWKDFCEDADHSRVQNEKEIFGKRCAKRPENVLWK